MPFSVQPRRSTIEETKILESLGWDKQNKEVTANGDRIAPANYETWTFVLEDDTEVEKEVCVK